MIVSVAIAWGSLTLAPPCTASVQGQLADAQTGDRVPQAKVTLRGDDEAEPRTTRSDDAGTYVFEGVCPGPYRLEAGRADYRSASRRIELNEAPLTANVTLRPHDVDVLDDVVVVAPAPAPADSDHASTLDDAALDAVRGAGLADALAEISGVTVLRSPAGGMGKPIIRGHVGRRNLILYDRVRHESQKWGIDHAPEIDPFAADSMTVLKGAAGLRYGADAIGGVVLVDPPPLPDEPGVSGETHFIGSSNAVRGATATRVQGTHAAAPGFAWRAEANATRGAAAMTPDYALDNTGSAVWNAAATLGYSRDGYGVEATYRHHDARLGLFSGLRNATPDEFTQSLSLAQPVGADAFSRDYAIERAFQRTTHDLALLRGTVPVADAGTFVLTYAYQDNHRDEFAVVREAIDGPQLTFDLRTHGADVVFEQTEVAVGASAVLEGEVGASYQRQGNTYDGADPAFLPDYVQDAGGVFAIERLVWSRVELEGGARYDGTRRVSTLDDRAFAPFGAQDRLPDDCRSVGADGDGECTTPFDAGSGSLGVLVRPVASVPRLTLRTDAMTGARPPATDEQFIKGSAPAFPVFSNGNGRLGLERTWGGSVTATFANAWLFVEGAGYTNFIDDYIYFRAFPRSDDPNDPDFSECAPLTCGVQGSFPLFEPEAVDALFYGGELSATTQPPEWPVRFDLRASWVRAQQTGSGDPLVFIPPDRYRLGVTYQWPDLGMSEHGFVGVAGTFVDRQRRFDEAADFATPPPAYGLLEASTGIEVPFSGQRLQLALVGRNLTNARYRDYTSLLRYFANEPGWDLTLRLTLQFAFVRPGD